MNAHILQPYSQPDWPLIKRFQERWPDATVHSGGVPSLRYRTTIVFLAQLPRLFFYGLRIGLDVDLDFFKAQDRARAREELGMGRTTLLSVDNLMAFKGHGVVIEALSLLPECDLLIAGDGPDRAVFEALAAQRGVSGRVRFTGAIEPETLRRYYSAADALVLASSREGWPNVLLEAMACGTPVIATSVGGVPEIVGAEEAGIVLKERSATAIAEAVRRLLAAAPERAATRRYAEQFGWTATTNAQLQLFQHVLATTTPTPAMAATRTS